MPIASAASLPGARHPVPVVILAAAPALAWQSRRLTTGLSSSGEWLPPRMESAVALRELQVAGRSGIAQTINVFVELPPGHDVLSPPGWNAVRRMRERLTPDRRIAAVYSFNAFSSERPLSRLTFLFIPRARWRPFLTEDHRSVLLAAVPAESANARDLVALVEELRALDGITLTGLAGTRVLVGGLPAYRADYLRAVSGRLPMVVGLVLLGTMAALSIGFRSVLVPLKAIVLNLLAVGAGCGAVVVVFQDGVGLGLLGWSGGTVDRVFPVFPAIVFCTVFGLSMDYEVFLVARVAEAERSGLRGHEAIASALASTGPVITSAAAVMVAVFGAFTLGEFLLVKMLGVALTTAVLVDATLLRCALGPALLTLAGRWNWWPGNLGRQRP